MILSATIASQVTAALTALGSTPGEVAQTLASKGIRGRKAEADQCAIAEYVREQFPELTWISVGPQVVHFALSDRSDIGSAWLPPAAQGALRNFDAGAYPDLIAP